MKSRRWGAGLVLSVLLLAPAQARPVLVEMFTSQNCSSCPPADALLAKLARDKNILALSFNVTYWANPYWTDPYALKAASERQFWYAGLAHSQDVYTPEAVVDGTAQLVGSDADKINAAIAAARLAPAGDVPVTLKYTPNNMVHITIGPGEGGATMWLFGYDSSHTTTIGGGENAGTTLTEADIVRSISNLGTWTGPATSLTELRPKGQHLAFILQLPNGAILAAAAK